MEAPWGKMNSGIKVHKDGELDTMFEIAVDVVSSRLRSMTNMDTNGLLGNSSSTAPMQHTNARALLFELLEGLPNFSQLLLVNLAHAFLMLHLGFTLLLFSCKF